MRKLKRVLAILLLTGIVISTSGCAVSLFSSEHKHYHHDKCNKKCDKKCKHETSLKLLEID